jgi:hypothetical protein
MNSDKDRNEKTAGKNQPSAEKPVNLIAVYMR